MTDESFIKRLVIAKKLYLHGCKHSYSMDQISKILAIHHFDNSVEIVLKCIADKKKLHPKSKYFYFDELLNQIKELPYKEHVKSLHDIRNNVQHHADIPDPEVIIKYKSYILDFLKEVIKNEFNIDYDHLFLSMLIENKNLRNLITSAEMAFSKGDFKRAIELCEDAFIDATFKEAKIIEVAGMLTGYWGGLDELKKVISEEYAEKYEGKEFYSLAKDLSKAIVQFGSAATSMQLLDEYKMDFLEHRKIIENLQNLKESELSNKCLLTINFVVNVILRWQEKGLLNSQYTE